MTPDRIKNSFVTYVTVGDALIPINYAIGAKYTADELSYSVYANPSRLVQR